MRGSPWGETQSPPYRPVPAPILGALRAPGVAIGACSVTGSIGSDGQELGGNVSSSTTSLSTGTGTLRSTPPFDKIDILLAIDNSPSMADKQQILSLAILDLMESLINPSCLDIEGQPVAGQPSSSFDACPAGSTRDFPPILDIHIGVVTSSIGGHGSDACSGNGIGDCPGGAVNASADDRGHLITRADPCGSAVVPPTRAWAS